MRETALFLALSALVFIATTSASAESGGSSLQFRGDLFASGLLVASQEAERPLLPAAAGAGGLSVELALPRWIPLRFTTRYYATGASRPDESLFLYRAFQGLSFGLATGPRFDLGKLELDLLAGGAVSVSNYTGTSLVSAYPSLVVEPRLRTPLHIGDVQGIDLAAGLPLEYMFRGAVKSVAVGLEIALSLRPSEIFRK